MTNCTVSVFVILRQWIYWLSFHTAWPLYPVLYNCQKNSVIKIDKIISFVIENTPAMTPKICIYNIGSIA